MAEGIKGAETKKEYIVDGFLFFSEADAAAAREELKKARYLERHLDNQGANIIHQLYQKALQERTFQTPVGLAFVKLLRDRLIEEGVEEFDIEPIPVYYDVTQNKIRSGHEPVKEEPKEKPEKRMTKFKISFLLNVFLILLVAGMFYVAMTGDNPNILNYENALVNKYASWEQELSEREKTVREKEQELDLR